MGRWRGEIAMGESRRQIRQKSRLFGETFLRQNLFGNFPKKPADMAVLAEWPAQGWREP
jgi:hypothetical protein